MHKLLNGYAYITLEQKYVINLFELIVADFTQKYVIPKFNPLDKIGFMYNCYFWNIYITLYNKFDINNYFHITCSIYSIIN
jgi:hypothetical protein